MKRTLFVIGWLICSFISYGVGLGTMENRFPYFREFGVSIALSTLGPFSLVGEFVSFPISGLPLHWKLLPNTKEQRWEAHKKRWPLLDRDYFEQND